MGGFDDVLLWDAFDDLLLVGGWTRREASRLQVHGLNHPNECPTVLLFGCYPDFCCKDFFWPCSGCPGCCCPSCSPDRLSISIVRAK